MNRQDRDRCPPVEIRKIVSVLPTDYVNITNKPTINGVTLEGEMTGKSLSLLSSDEAEHETVSLIESQKKDRYFVAIGQGKSYKVPVDDVVEQSKLAEVTDQLDKNAPVGTFQFVKIK